MKTQTIKQRLLHSTMIGGAALMALVAAPAVMLATPTAAVAQDYTTGTLAGTVQGNDGQPISGATVTVRSAAQGITRSSVTGADGGFRIALIPTGAYDVTIEAPGRETLSERVNVTLGGVSNFAFTVGSAGGADGATNVGEVVVTGVRRQLDLSRTATGVTVDVDELVDQVPVARNVTAVTLLAPGAVAGDTSFAVGSAQLQAPPSISGASPAENAFFVNGLNITNFVNGLGGATVPFEFYKTVEVKTGGYSAEFGRATGGVINAITKSGTNDFVLELHGTWAPDSLREDSPNGVTTPNGPGAYNALSGFEEKTFTIEMGGPIIRDRLFAYGIVAYQDTESQVADMSGTYSEDTFNDDPFYGVKLDGYITDDHRLEFTYFDTSRTRTRNNYAFDTTTGVIDYAAGPLTIDTLEQGGENWVGRYTGTLTDWLTVSAAYGESTTNQSAVNNLIGESRVNDFRSGDNIRRSRQTALASTTPFLAERTFWRADADIFFDMMGQHHVRLGYDHEETLLTEFSIRNGGRNIEYRIATADNTLGLADGDEYILTRSFTAGGGFEGENAAWYIHDSWDVNDNLNLQIGFRNDTFSVADPNGTTFIDFDGEKALRLGFAYDPMADGTMRFYGSYGRYFLPPASNTAFRIASPAIDYNEFFRGSGPGGTIGGLDPVTGLPTAGFGTQITAATGATSLQTCPNGVGATQPGVVACSVRDDGTSTPPELITARNLESTYEDEFRLGFEYRLTDLWTVGVNGTYRKLGRVVEDALLDQGVIGYCQREGIPMTIGIVGGDAGAADGEGCAELFPGQSYYLIINPGFDTEVTLPVTFDGEAGPRTITLSAEDLGIPKATREYTALEFTFERAFDGVWGLQGSYVLSRSEGNYEGAVKSDIGQTDAGIVQDFDFLSFIPGAYGLLPNHRGHQFKAFGSWQATPELLVGANVSVTSPRRYGCIGLAPNDYAGGEGQVANDSYGAAARFCNNLVVDRGSVFATDWVTRFDLSLRYSLDDLVPGNLVLRADIFNVFDLDSSIQANEFGEGDDGQPEGDYQAPTAFQAPRSVRIGFDWAF
ncbi:TonB-dependent receptor [Brevundimonas sp.]|uniref:TonB-dependent receptor n=1 Tax=Brevundimonas sp. TaxID=1871086 RepID=UPI002D489A96|nr:TonB-dependent receptor [Brevundimonas sp.]HYD26640.1 TonB-dependent receptor [Brevundimonas sp.]